MSDILEKHLVKLVTNEPFYSFLSRCINKEASNRIPTAGVYVKGGEFYLRWCPAYVESLNDVQVQELLKHEFLHLVLGHCTTRIVYRNNKPDPVFYFACDLAINSMLNIKNLPTGGLVPGQFRSIPAGHRHLYDEEFIRCHEKLAEVVRGFPLFKSADWYYERLIKDPDVVKAIEALDQKGRGAFDVHGLESEMNDSDREIANQKIQNIFGKAIKEADNEIGGWGSTPYATRRLLKQINNSSVDWAAMLRYFIGIVRAASRSRSFKRINRRCDLLPGLRRKRVGRIAVAIDMSGSVTDAMIARIFAELENLAHHVEFTVVPFDHAVDESKVFVWKKGEKLPPRRFRFGGTDFDAPTKWVNERRGQFDGMAIVTDGIGDRPSQCLVRRCWILVPYYTLRFKTDETVIQMAA